MRDAEGEGGRDEVESRLAEYLTTQLPGVTDLRLENLKRSSVGWSHETWLFDAVWTHAGQVVSRGMCARLDRGNTLLRDMSDLESQFRVLRCLAKTPLPTPEPYWYEPEPNVLGAPFLVMAKVEGVCPDPWGSEGRRFYAQAAARGVLPSSFVGTLAQLHNLDWEAAGLSFLGVPDLGQQFALRELAKWSRLIELSGHEPEPILVDVMGWLRMNAPSTDRLVLVHGAFRTGNVLVKDDQVSAVLDWELQAIGDPMFDVAYVLSNLNRDGTELLSNLVPRDQFYREYEAATGIEIDEDACRYYELLYGLRSAAFWMSASGLYASGRSDDLRLARTAWSVPVVLDRAARNLGY